MRTRYGEALLPTPIFGDSPLAAGLLVATPPALVAYSFGRQAGWGWLPAPPNLPALPSVPGASLSFADVKKFGVAGTVAYVITELAFWIVAFPVAAGALYQVGGGGCATAATRAGRKKKEERRKRNEERRTPPHRRHSVLDGPAYRIDVRT